MYIWLFLFKISTVVLTLTALPKAFFYNNFELDLAFNNVKPKDWYFVID